MNEWLKTNGLTLLLVMGSAVSVYTSIHSNQKALQIEVYEIAAHVKSVDRKVEGMPVLEQRIVANENGIGELKPIMANLAKGVNALNVTLAKMEGKLASK
ncbi:hypothetical protein NVP1152O_015 [Vibrio phage 1.152.O._10N.222.46.E1]|uniref:Uncharacterized protein n=5 Tax=Nahantvirus 49C7 TaxID=2846601 RepID=A0A2I7RB85_9CAUD|nr:hypothetical protein HYP57_gp014 [Vibrio phage 1.026.O._10N.222.49.C7]AUR82497.1 hypothetical protein NVP1025O_014 [Vibrio phage 1.025.O._10N.222.46.B6]AUR90747.1 hypothetical protein NVP1150O_014 [Vibrio phage 1.150.O._10N.222.46.A6]AUR90920.1 hypothetical protein NVP1152O_015 [Vibrio phage 1.152.O._10N.222.46.E1]AUS02388.1 hypothetical protein NVP2130O_014 [Vibrio phage 2.130.O._10N.222.46.C2]AUR82605.1 hypothetical protein NVP1026O_014 [Vibrio phage 1.026.O._10N.222.49.C7]